MKIHWNLLFKLDKNLTLLERKLKRHSLNKIGEWIYYPQIIFYIVITILAMQKLNTNNANIIIPFIMGMCALSYLALIMGDRCSENKMEIEEWILEKKELYAQRKN